MQLFEQTFIKKVHEMDKGGAIPIKWRRGLETTHEQRTYVPPKRDHSQDSAWLEPGPWESAQDAGARGWDRPRWPRVQTPLKATSWARTELYVFHTAPGLRV